MHQDKEKSHRMKGEEDVNEAVKGAPVACTFVNNISAYVDRPLCTVLMILLQCYCNCLSIIL